jgi:hypothetical protein
MATRYGPSSPGHRIFTTRGVGAYALLLTMLGIAALAAGFMLFLPACPASLEPLIENGHILYGPGSD